MANNGKKRKIPKHDIGQQALDNIRTIIDKTDVGLFREMTGRDYGIDGLVEVFDEGAVTGKFALVQCKGQEKIIKPLKTEPKYISCKGISSSNAEYALQNNSVVLLCFASSTDNTKFYFANLKEALTDDMKEKLTREKDPQKTISVRIPIENNSIDNMPKFWQIINSFYKNLNN